MMSYLPQNEPDLEKPIKTIRGTERHDYGKYIITGSSEYIAYIPGRRNYGIIHKTYGCTLCVNYGNGDEPVACPSASSCICFKISDVPELANIKDRQFENLYQFSTYVSKYVTIYDEKFYRTIKKPEPTPVLEPTPEFSINTDRQLGKIVINASGKYKIFNYENEIIEKGYVSCMGGMDTERIINLLEALENISNSLK